MMYSDARLWYMIIALITRHEVNVYLIQDADGLPLVVTQPNTNHIVCALRVCVCVCNCYVSYFVKWPILIAR